MVCGLMNGVVGYYETKNECHHSKKYRKWCWWKAETTDGKPIIVIGKLCRPCKIRLGSQNRVLYTDFAIQKEFDERKKVRV